MTLADMAKDKIKELEYEIEGLKRMIKRKVRRQRKNRVRSIDKIRLNYVDDHMYDGY